MARATVRDLAKRYLDICHSKENLAARERWRTHNSLVPGRPLVVCSAFFTSQLDREIAAALPELVSTGPLRDVEWWLRSRLWASDLPDDMVYDPWYVMPARRLMLGESIFDIWGVKTRLLKAEGSHGYVFLPAIESVEDLERLQALPHVIESEETDEIRAVRDAIGDLIPVHVDKSTAYPIWMGTDLSMAAGALLGLSELLYLIYENPELVHRLMAFMRDAVLRNLAQGEAAGDWSTMNHFNYGLPVYVKGLPDPEPGTYGARLADLWFFTHAQEFEGVGPEQFEEFLMQYQRPIMAKYGLVNYGCCETLDNKIDCLCTVPNLRRLLAGPRSNLGALCEAVAGDYVVSWRPSPACVAMGFDEAAVRKSIRDGFAHRQGCNVEVMLKEMLTVEGDLSRLFRWSAIAREEAEAA